MKYILVPIRTYTPRRNYQLTPQNEEFGRAGKSSGLIHRAVQGMINPDKNCRQYGHLAKRLYQILQTDEEHIWGKRTVQDGDISLLEGYDFNCRRPLGSLLRARREISINGVTGICRVHIPVIDPSIHLSHTGSPSHVRFSLVATCFDFEGDRYHSAMVKSPFLPLNKAFQVDLLTMATVCDEKPIFLFLGIQFFHYAQKTYWATKAGTGACIHVIKTARGIVEP